MSCVTILFFISNIFKAVIIFNTRVNVYRSKNSNQTIGGNRVNMYSKYRLVDITSDAHFHNSTVKRHPIYDHIWQPCWNVVTITDTQFDHVIDSVNKGGSVFMSLKVNDETNELKGAGTDALQSIGQSTQSYGWYCS